MKERLNYIDAIRGFAIFLVVYLHFGAWSMSVTVPNKFIEIAESFFIPLFFFISGFIGYKEEIKNNLGGALLWNKTKTLLIPTITFFLLAAWHFGFSPFGWLQGGTKAGYWFAYILFQLFVIYYGIKVILSYVKTKKYELLLFGVLLAECFIGCYALCGTLVGDFLSTNLVVYSGFIYFFTGLLAGRYRKTFLTLQDNKWYIWGLLAFTLIEWNIIPIHWTVHCLSMTLLVFALFYHERKWFDGNYWYQRLLPMMGRYSLAIYFLHYWLLFDMPEEVSNWINWTAEQPCFVPGGSSVFAYNLIVVPVVLVTCLTCCFIKRLLAFIPYANQILFGDKSEQQ